MENIDVSGKPQASNQDLKIIRSITDSRIPAKPSTSVLIDDDSVSINMSEVYKSLTVLGDNIVKKLDEILKKEMPEGVASLDPTQYTPENTAQRVVSTATVSFEGFAKQFKKDNPNADDAAILSKYMGALRSGISKGYEQAAGILSDLKAFDFEGVKSGVDETMRLIEEKLKLFEESKTKKAEAPPLEAEQTK